MARGKKFNVFMEHVTIDYPTLMKYRKILDDYIKKHDLWDVNTRECWLFDLIDFKLQGNAGLCYRSIRMLESHWGFDSDNDDIDFYIIRHMRELQKKIIEEEKAQTEINLISPKSTDVRIEIGAANIYIPANEIGVLTSIIKELTSNV